MHQAPAFFPIRIMSYYNVHSIVMPRSGEPDEIIPYHYRFVFTISASRLGRNFERSLFEKEMKKVRYSGPSLS